MVSTDNSEDDNDDNEDDADDDADGDDDYHSHSDDYENESDNMTAMVLSHKGNDDDIQYGNDNTIDDNNSGRSRIRRLFTASSNLDTNPLSQRNSLAAASTDRRSKQSSVRGPRSKATAWPRSCSEAHVKLRRLD